MNKLIICWMRMWMQLSENKMDANAEWMQFDGNQMDANAEWMRLDG